LRNEGPCSYPLKKIREVLFQILSVGVFRHTIDANGLASIKAAVAFAQQFDVDDMSKVVEHHLRVLARLHFYAGEFRGRRLVRFAVSFHVVSLGSAC